MSKKSQNSSGVFPTVGFNSGYVVFDHEINNLLGKILTLVESLGLKDTQEKATKDIARDFVYSLYRSDYITGEAVSEAFRITREAGVANGGGMGSIPTPPLS